MGIPRVPLQVRRAPVLALRAVFAGFGRLVMLADRQEPIIVVAARAAEAPPPGLWVDGIHLWAQVDVGIIGNPEGPADGLNFGQLFTDHANQVQMNQLLLTANKPLG